MSLSPALVILCRRPGFRRGGIAHPARAEYPAGAFTPEELAAIKAEPLLELLPADADAPPQTGGADSDVGASTGGGATGASPPADAGGSDAGAENDAAASGAAVPKPSRKARG